MYICIRIYRCVYIYMYVCVYTHTYTDMYVYAWVCVHSDIYQWVHPHSYLWLHHPKKTQKQAFIFPFAAQLKKKKKKKKKSKTACYWVETEHRICFWGNIWEGRDVLYLSPDYGYFSMVQNILIIVSVTMGVNNVLNLGRRFKSFKKTSVQWFEIWSSLQTEPPLQENKKEMVTEVLNSKLCSLLPNQGDCILPVLTFP